MLDSIINQIKDFLSNKNSYNDENFLKLSEVLNIILYTIDKHCSQDSNITINHNKTCITVTAKNVNLSMMIVLKDDTVEITFDEENDDTKKMIKSIQENINKENLKVIYSYKEKISDEE